MDLGRRRSTGGRGTTNVVAGSVWETRMKLDEVKGGIKVFNGSEENNNNNNNNNSNNTEETVVGSRVMKRAQNQINGGSVSTSPSSTTSGKRKTWKSDTFDGFERSPIQIARGLKSGGDDYSNHNHNQNLSVSVGGIKKSPVQGKRVVRSEATSKEIERSPVGVRRPRTELLKAKSDSAKPASMAIQVDEGDKNGDGIGLEKEECEEIDEKSLPVEVGSGEACEEFGVCEEKVISSNFEAPKSDEDCDDLEENEGEEMEVVVDEEIEMLVDEEMEVLVDEEIEVEEKGIEIKEIKAQEIKEVKAQEIKEIKAQETNKPKEIKTPETKPNKVMTSNAEKVVVSEVKRVNFERKLEVRNNKNNHNNNKVLHQKQTETISLNVRKQTPLIKRSTIHSTFANSRGPSTKFPSSSASHQHHSFPETHSRLQSFVDLIMWKDISRSVFIFGIGTFTILSSSYTKDLKISFISVISYLGLVYLAAIFLFRSIVCRGVIDMDYTSYVVGEEEAIWLLKLVLPYLNEFLLKLKALFSGDPATTMKLAALLFVLARCGSSITIWTMAKLGFFGVFTVPKVCSLYSTQITAYAKFWVRRFRDAWDSCSHKKGVTVAVFLLVWNLSSIVARIWAVFMLFVAFRYYQQNLVANDWVEDGEEGEDTWHEPIGDQRQGSGPTIVDYTKQKKRS